MERLGGGRPRSEKSGRAKDEAEARHIKRLQREELLDLRKKRHWGGVGATARWRLHLDGVPTSLANGTYGLLGAPSVREHELAAHDKVGRRWAVGCPESFYVSHSIGGSQKL